MSNVIEFLERLGADARLRDASNHEIKEALDLAKIEPAQQAALLTGDGRALETLLGVKANSCCLIHAPDDDEDESETEQDDDNDDGGEDDVLSSQRSAIRRGAAAI